MYKELKHQNNCESDHEYYEKDNINQDTIPYLMDSQPVRSNEIIKIELPYCVRNSLLVVDPKVKAINKESK